MYCCDNLRTRHRFLFVLAWLVIMVAFSALSFGQSGEEALLQADRAFNKATQEKKLEGWMQFMAEDVVLLREKPVLGKVAAREAIKGDWGDPTYVLSWEPKHAELFKSGTMGYTSGRWTYRGTGPKGEKLAFEGDYLTVWQKQTDGSWKVIYDSGTPDPQPK
jgi:ketosteroid isomerase-like protein